MNATKSTGASLPPWQAKFHMLQVVSHIFAQKKTRQYLVCNWWPNHDPIARRHVTCHPSGMRARGRDSRIHYLVRNREILYARDYNHDCEKIIQMPQSQVCTRLESISHSPSLTYLRAATSLSEKRMRVTEGEGVSENAANSSICSCNFAPSTNKLSPALPLHTPSRPMSRQSPDSSSPIAIAIAMAMDHSHNKPTLYRGVIAETNSLVWILRGTT